MIHRVSLEFAVVDGDGIKVLTLDRGGVVLSIPKKMSDLVLFISSVDKYI